MPLRVLLSSPFLIQAGAHPGDAPYLSSSSLEFEAEWLKRDPENITDSPSHGLADVLR